MNKFELIAELQNRYAQAPSACIQIEEETRRYFLDNDESIALYEIPEVLAPILRNASLMVYLWPLYYRLAYRLDEDEPFTEFLFEDLAETYPSYAAWIAALESAVHIP